MRLKEIEILHMVKCMRVLTAGHAKGYMPHVCSTQIHQICVRLQQIETESNRTVEGGVHRNIDAQGAAKMHA
jgi:hypothetical protein